MCLLLRISQRRCVYTHSTITRARKNFDFFGFAIDYRLFDISRLIGGSSLRLCALRCESRVYTRSTISRARWNSEFLRLRLAIDRRLSPRWWITSDSRVFHSVPKNYLIAVQLFRAVRKSEIETGSPLSNREEETISVPRETSPNFQPGKLLKRAHLCVNVNS